MHNYIKSFFFFFSLQFLLQVLSPTSKKKKSFVSRAMRLEEDEFMGSKLDTRVDDPSKYNKANHNCLINDDEGSIWDQLILLKLKFFF